MDEASAQVAAHHLGWSKERVDREVREYRDFVWRFNPRDLRETEPLKA